MREGVKGNIKREKVYFLCTEKYSAFSFSLWNLENDYIHYKKSNKQKQQTTQHFTMEKNGNEVMET
jgi:cell division protein FtsB